MKAKILFVDDEQPILESLRRCFRPMRDKWDMSFSLGGQAALDLLTRVPHDVVVSDMRMPGLDGAQFLREVQVRYPESVRIILSGYSEELSVLKTVKIAHQYLSKPCKPENLIEAVEKALSLRGLLECRHIKALVGRLGTLPSLPEAYHRLVVALEDENSTLKALGDIVSDDVAMTASILRLVNSSFFGPPHRISSIHHAVNLIGGQTLRVLVLSTHLFSVLEPAVMPPFSVKSLWEHSQRTACFARIVAKAENACQADQDNGFIGGMLHDIGKLILATSLPDQYRKIVTRVQKEAIPIHAAEIEELGTSHAEVGAYLMGLWGFSQSVLEAVCWHHAPERQVVDPFSPILAVHVSNTLDHSLVRFHDGYAAWPLAFPGMEGPDFQERLSMWRERCANAMEASGCGQ